MKKILAVVTVLSLTFAASASESDFFTALSAAVENMHTLPPAPSPLASSDTMMPEWKSVLVNGDSSMAAAICAEKLASLTPGTLQFNAAADYLDEYYRKKQNDSIAYLNRMMDTEAISLTAGMPDARRLNDIGRMLESRDPERAIECYRLAIRAALNRVSVTDNTDYGHSMRVLSVTNATHTHLAYWIIAIASLLIGVTVTVTLRRVLSHKRRSATDASTDGDAVCAQSSKAMLNLALLAFSQTKEYNLLVDRKLTAGQTKDLYNSVNSVKLIGEASAKFYNAFDAAVLATIPAFIERLNRLLQTDRRFTLPADGKLSPELRMAALIHLDITDSGRLAEILGLSMNTIYTYRNRLKGRAIDRTTFEEALRTM